MLGHFTGETTDQTVQLNADAIGQVKVLNEVIEVSYDDVKHLVKATAKE